MQRRQEAELVALARSGNKQAFGLRVERYQRVAERVALGMVRSEQVAQDLAQEAILSAYLSLGNLRDDTRFGSWLYGIVLNVCRSYIRAQRTTSLSWEALPGGMQFETIRLSSLTPSPAEIVEQHELHQAVLEAVNTLSPKQREATLLYYYGQLTQREVATTTRSCHRERSEAIPDLALGDSLPSPTVTAGFCRSGDSGGLRAQGWGSLRHCAPRDDK